MKYQYQDISEEGLITSYFYNTLEELIINWPNSTSYFELVGEIYIMKYIY
jgi:hypothetical protein